MPALHVPEDFPSARKTTTMGASSFLKNSFGVAMLLHRSLLLAAFAAWGAFSTAACGDENSNLPLQHAVKQLASNRFTEREAANEKLQAAGELAIPLLEAATQTAELETTNRILGLLEQFAIDTTQPVARDSALAVLERLATSEKQSLAGRAGEILTAIREVERARAIEALEKLGAEFKTQQVIAAAFLATELSVEFGPAWRGKTEDLARLAEVYDLRSIVLVGPQVTDAWMEQIATLEMLRSVRLKKAAITGEGLAKLKSLPQLQLVEIFYIPLEDAALDCLAEMPQLSQLRLFGTKITKPAGEKLETALPLAKIDIRRGGFLGIGVSRIRWDV